MALEETVKITGQLKPVRGGKPCQNMQPPVFPQDCDVAIRMFVECLHRNPSTCSKLAATHAQGNTVNEVLSHPTSPRATEL